MKPLRQARAQLSGKQLGAYHSIKCWRRGYPRQRVEEVVHSAWRADSFRLLICGEVGCGKDPWNENW